MYLGALLMGLDAAPLFPRVLGLPLWLDAPLPGVLRGLPGAGHCPKHGGVCCEGRLARLQKLGYPACESCACPPKPPLR